MTKKLYQKQKIKEISKILQKKYLDIPNVGIMTGVSGIALFQFYYAKYLGSDDDAGIATEMLTHALNKINSGYNFPNYCDGIAGLCWTIQHLETANFLNINADEFLEPFDAFLYDQMNYDINQQDFDFFHGALGYGFYFLSRYTHTSDLDLKKQYEQYLLHLILRLENFVIVKEDMLTWESTLNTRTKTKGFDLGLSHGMASIINFLSRLHRFEVFNKSTERLIKGSITFLLSTESKRKADLSLFPNVIENEKTAYYNSRISWCYGDLGIGLSLLKAGNMLKDKWLQKKAYAIFKHTAKRRTAQETLVIDAGICHGSYGNALIYRNVARNTKNNLFMQTSTFWMKDGMKKAVHKDGYAGYKQWCNNRKDWVAELSLLEGIAGIGLTIINYLSKKQYKWDECLLIS